jgi:hypothetical protein
MAFTPLTELINQAKIAKYQLEHYLNGDNSTKKLATRMAVTLSDKIEDLKKKIENYGSGEVVRVSIQLESEETLSMYFINIKREDALVLFNLRYGKVYQGKPKIETIIGLKEYISF